MFLLLFSFLPYYCRTIESIPLKAIYDGTLNDNKGGVSLNWEDLSTNYEFYKIMRYIEGKDPQTISTMDFLHNTTVKVLNIYPTGTTSGYGMINDATYTVGDNEFSLPLSASLKVWMEGGSIKFQNGTVINIEAAGEIEVNGEKSKLINVDCKSNKEFRDDPSMIWNYDVVMIGTWDCNNAWYVEGNRGADNVNSELSKYISKGYGVLLGHDILGFYFGKTISYGPLLPFLKMKVGPWDNDIKTSMNPVFDYNVTSGYYSVQVRIKKNGLLTQYPWNIGEINTILNIPLTHTCAQVSESDVWIELDDIYQKYTSRDKPPPDGITGNYKFYLTTNNNIAMIQTGHSNCESTNDERKIIANTLFYLKQRSYEKYSLDNDMRDESPPGQPSIESYRYLSNKIQIKLTISD